MKPKPKSWSHWTPERIDMLGDMRIKGLSLAEIAIRTGIDRETIKQAASRFGKTETWAVQERERLGLIGPAPKRDHWPPHVVAKMRRLAEEGLTATEIASRLGAAYTRCAVLGKCHQLYITLGHTPNGHMKPGFVPREPEPEPPPAIDPNEDRRRPDKRCSDGCGKTAAPGYLHGRCPSCNAKHLARKPRERARVIDDEGQRGIGVQRYG